MPMFTTILCRCGTAIGFEKSNSFISTGATSLRKRSFSRGVSFALWRATPGAACASCDPPFFSFLSFAINSALSYQLLALVQCRSALLANSYFAVAAHFVPNAYRAAGGAHQLHLR